MDNKSLIEYEEVNGIKIYKGTTESTRTKYENEIKFLKDNADSNEKLFTNLQPSTLTAKGLFSNISFDESDIIHMLSEPTGYIMKIGCNYGEKFNKNYVVAKVVKKSGRGRKPKPKPVSKRRVQGLGKYFSSQITFVIKHPKTEDIYKIKLFRNGVFQVPGIKDPNMLDLIEPIHILRDYLSYNFREDVKVVNFIAVMRNYKAKLILDKWHVDLEKLEEIIDKEKSYRLFSPCTNYMLSCMNQARKNKCMAFIGKTNVMNIAEISYNTDKCFCLIIKFYRPMPNCTYKKTTVKLLKKGKINFDGGNSELEVIELYHWLENLYITHKKDILVDVATIENKYDEEKIAKLNERDFIYSDDDICSECSDDAHDSD